jgi:hypothetical protein
VQRGKYIEENTGKEGNRGKIWREKHRGAGQQILDINKKTGQITKLVICPVAYFVV